MLLQGRGAAIRTVLTMHRIPFWMGPPTPPPAAAAAAAGALPVRDAVKRAVVMYVAPVTGSPPHRYFPAGMLGVMAGVPQR